MTITNVELNRMSSQLNFRYTFFPRLCVLSEHLSGNYCFLVVTMASFQFYSVTGFLTVYLITFNMVGFTEYVKYCSRL